MIRGEVTADHEAVIPILVHGSSDLVLEIAAVVDTGFSDYLTLSPDLVTLLQLTLLDGVEFTLANGITERMRTFHAIVGWNGQEREIVVTETDGDPLIGMALLSGSRLTVDIVDGGAVTIEPLPAAPSA